MPATSSAPFLPFYRLIACQRHVSLPSENVPTLHPGFQVHFRPIAGSSDYKVFPGDISVVHMTEVNEPVLTSLPPLMNN